MSLQAQIGELDKYGADRVADWAAAFESRFGPDRSTRRLQELRRAELALRGDGPEVRLRRGMALLDFELFVCALVYHRSREIVPKKVREIQSITGTAMSRRAIWDKLSAVNHYGAGLAVMSNYLLPGA